MSALLGVVFDRDVLSRMFLSMVDGNYNDQATTTGCLALNVYMDDKLNTYDKYSRDIKGALWNRGARVSRKSALHDDV